MEHLEEQLHEAVRGREAAQESAEIMRAQAESASATLSDLRNELLSTGAAAAEEVCPRHLMRTS